METSPPKPEFYKPLIPGFENGLRIPTFFSKHYLGSPKPFPREAMLRMNGERWIVGVRDQHFSGHRWTRFSDDNNLVPGDIAVFKHRGCMVFDVTVYDGITSCKKKPRTSSEKPRFEECSRTVHGRGNGVEISGRSSFLSTIKAYSLGHNQCLYIPKSFAQENDLWDKKKMVLENKVGRRWLVKLVFSNVGRSRLIIRCGWKRFVEDNGFRKGDVFEFKIIKNGAIPVARFTVY